MAPLLALVHHRLARPRLPLVPRHGGDRLDRHVVLLRRARQPPARARAGGGPRRGRRAASRGRSTAAASTGSTSSGSRRRGCPKPLHWYKWEAYWTWLSGFALLCIVYYSDARLRLIDPSVADLEPWQAILISIGAARRRVARLRRSSAACSPTGRWPFALVILGLVTATAYGVGELYAPRAAYLQVGAMLGTIMAANVLFVIIPGHWELVRAKEAGREPDPRPGILGQAALGAQQLPDAAGALHDARRPLPVHVHARPRLGGARRADGRRRRDPPLLQPPPRRRDALVDPGRLRLRDRRDRGLAAPARRRSPPPGAATVSVRARRGRSSRRAARPATRCTRRSPGSLAAGRRRPRHAGADPRAGVPDRGASRSTRPSCRSATPRT